MSHDDQDAHPEVNQKTKRLFKISLYSFLAGVGLLVAAFVFFIHSLATHKGSSWGIVPSDTILLAAGALVIAALSALLSMITGSLIAFRKRIVLVWLIPEFFLFFFILWYFIRIQ